MLKEAGQYQELTPENIVYAREADECQSIGVSVVFYSKLLTRCFVFHYLATNWASGEDDHVVARAEYDFSAASEEEISVRAGDMLNLAPKGEISLMNPLN